MPLPKTATNQFESMTEQHRFEMAAANTLARLKASGKEFTQKELLEEAQREFEKQEVRLGLRRKP